MPFEVFLQSLRSQESPKVQAFRTVMSALSACGLQSAAFFNNMLNTSYSLPYSAVSPPVRAGLTLLLGDEATAYLAAHPSRSISLIDTVEETEEDIVEQQPVFYRYEYVAPP